MRKTEQERIDVMRTHWERFAREDPLYYISCVPPGTGPEEFFAQGRDLANWTLKWLGDYSPRGRMLEIGCGLGRMLRHFSPAFERVDGIDISPEMIMGAHKFERPENVYLQIGSGTDLAPYPDGVFDFVFCSQVFQHIPDTDVIEKYLCEIARVLRPGGRAALQFDTRRVTLAARIYFVLPERLRGRSHAEYIRRYRRDQRWLRDTIVMAGLRLLDERGAETALHWMLLTR